MIRGRNFHMGVNIAGFLRAYEGKSMKGILLDDDGSPLSDELARKELARRQELGHTLISSTSECKEFNPFSGGCPGHPIHVLVVNVKREYFEAIDSGDKKEEYRQKTPFWKKRLEGKHFDEVEVRLGYPSLDDEERRIRFKFNGVIEKTLTHPIFGTDPVDVYAIQLGERL